jgi:DNA-binding MarR family transcriptional regulator
MPTKAPPDLERDAAALYAAGTAFIRVYQFRRRDHGLQHGLTVVQAYAIDLLLASGGASLTALAGALHLDKSTASRVVAGMERHGLIEWSRPEHDRRGKAIVVSREGRRRYERLRRAIVRENAQLLSAYSATERRAIVKALRQLAERAALR